MSAFNSYGKPNDEMFLQRKNTTNESPIIEPLRIQKRSSNASSTMSAGVVQQQQPSGGNQFVMPSLPYPDDRARQEQLKAQAARANGAASPYQYPDPRRVGSPQNRSDNTSPFDPVQRAGSAGSGRAAMPGLPGLPAELQAGQPTLAERRGTNAPKPLPDSPGPEAPDKDGLFQRQFQRSNIPQSAPASETSFPAPTIGNAAQAAFARLNIRDPNRIGRIDSTASTSTTKATRGSPPPPETPIEPPPSLNRPLTDIEQRFANSGIAGAGTLTALQAQSAAAQARAANYGGRGPSQPQQAQSQPPQRPWTPTEQPGASPHPAPTVYQGDSEVSDHPQQSAARRASQSQPRPNDILSQSSPYPARTTPFENETNRLPVADEPPPAYSSVSGMRPGQYPAEKGRLSAQQPINQQSAQQAPTATPQPQLQAQPIQQPQPQQHPAFANDHRPLSAQSPVQQNGAQINIQQSGIPQRAPSQSIPPASPPPLPEGWIAHLDSNSGQYYYIHLPTQSTQWEFPKGPTPLNLNETPLSPTGTAAPLASPGLSFMHKPLMSPGLPMSPGFDQQSVMSGATTVAFTGPPPTSGVDLYKIAPTNGVYFGPYLRYTNMDLELGFWYGSILLVSDGPQPPTIHLHQSIDLSPNPRQLKAQNIAQHQRWSFYRYDLDVRMEIDGPAKWTYAITSHLGCTRYEFLVAGRYETNWRFIAVSGNDFSLGTSANERARLGGPGYMWKDITQKHAECGGFHVQLGLGGQISADRLWKEIPSLKQWLATSGKDTRKNAQWTAAHEEDVSHAYFHYYTSHFDQPYLREAFAQIPHVCQIDDHDIFDGFGSYPDYMQFSNMFKNIGRIGIEMYLLFQHHTTLEILRNVSDDRDLFTITGTGWHFVKFLGPAVAVVGPDTRSERNPHQVMAGPTYQGIFPKIAMLPQSVQHCILMIAVPIIYPRLDNMEQLASSVATGKKAVTGAYNMLGKVTSSVAGVVGAKGAVGSGFDSVKRAVGKSGLMGGILNPFGDIDMLDELKDQWTHESKDLERTYLIRTLQGIAHNRNIRFTVLSGSTNTAGAGLVHDPSHPQDHKTMYQLISSSVVAAPPNSYILKMLNSNKPLYIPANGQRSTPHIPTDTKEDMMELFTVDGNGQPNTGNRRLIARRGYVAIVAYDPEVVNGNFRPAGPAQGSGKLSLAADFLVQSEGSYGGVMKYGPVVIPSLEFGR
ncbi:hypothetical protein LTR05_000510 [Lithohypha guttulata]|uniref:WW domain-containing protein n=1 Tax=Lithohypha guttulata TaxID=1690604 RepID=A0AAN7T5D3_9EURO|nr:hypothetical protein LTR05_000510 [Lithohypha guttulata]